MIFIIVEEVYINLYGDSSACFFFPPQIPSQLVLLEHIPFASPNYTRSKIFVVLKSRFPSYSLGTCTICKKLCDLPDRNCLALISMR